MLKLIIASKSKKIPKSLAEALPLNSGSKNVRSHDLKYLELLKDYTSYSDSEIITLEEVGPGLSDEAAINGLSNQLQKGLVTDQTRSQQSKGMIFPFLLFGNRRRRTSGMVPGHE